MQMLSSPSISPSSRSKVMKIYGLNCVLAVSALFVNPNGKAITAVFPEDVLLFGVLSLTILPLTKVPLVFVTLICELVQPILEDEP